MGDNGDVGSRVSNACEHEAVVHLGLVQERLVTLINGARRNLAGARRAGSGTA